MVMAMRQVPEMTTDEEAESFLDQDLSGLDFRPLQPLDWERLPKTSRVIMRVQEPLLAALKAKARGVPYQRVIREASEKAV